MAKESRDYKTEDGSKTKSLRVVIVTGGVVSGINESVEALAKSLF
jgi:hypothetical protein